MATSHQSDRPKRLLILAPTFYPAPGIAGIRVTQWARLLPDLGWEVHVLCKHYGYDAAPDDFAEHVHPLVQVHYLGPKRDEPLYDVTDNRGPATQNPVRKLISSLIVPDTGLLGWRRLRGQAERIAREIAPSIVLSSSPRHSIHWLGRRVAQAAGAKWVADFRDPFMIDARFQPVGWRKLLYPLFKRFERMIYREADLTLHAIPLHGRWARRTYPDSKGPAEVLPNGAPRELIDLAATRRSQVNSKRLSLRSVGRLGHEAPALLDQALRQLAGEGIDIEFLHAGRVPETVANLPADASQRLTFAGRVPHSEAIELVAGADMLVAFLSQQRSQVLGISSKLFEFLATGVPVLVVNPTRTDRQLLRRHGDCQVLANPDLDQLAPALRQMVQAAERGHSAADPRLIERFSRRRQAEQLAEWLGRMID